MNEFERRSLAGMLKSEFYCKAPPKVQEVLRRCPPYMMYELKDNNQFVSIVQLHEDKEDADKPVLIEVIADPKYNEGLLAFHNYFGVPPEALTPVIHRSLVDMERMITKAQRKWMPTLANRVQAVNRARQKEAELRLELFLHNKDKLTKTSVPTSGLIIKPGDVK